MAVSTFVPKGRLIRHQPGRKRIPGSITIEDFVDDNRILRGDSPKTHRQGAGRITGITKGDLQR